ncbi:rhomboid family intramembrane serine protease [uncultured Treponema sp.]|uniref:rhomboid family intramembrane serine protease n=1 Tax=uncultured Treponema sp. TaxID=162155 RepID=UPI00280C2CDA|nr:rhomboid family intramembrane serine protease [uncultured Treponema sp.]
MTSIISVIRKPFRYTFKNATLAIILINTAIFFLEKIFPQVQLYFSLNVYTCLGYKMFWQPFTYMFVHGSFSHVFFNMLGLFFFGLAVERAVGTKEFVLMYLFIGFAGGIFSLVFYWLFGMYAVFLMGASGAIYGILFSYAVLFPRNRVFIWGLIPVPAPILVIAYAAIEFFDQFLSFKDGVAHSVHLAGFAFAFLYFIARFGVNPIKVWKDAYR